MIIPFPAAESELGSRHRRTELIRSEGNLLCELTSVGTTGQKSSLAFGRLKEKGSSRCGPSLEDLLFFADGTEIHVVKINKILLLSRSPLLSRKVMWVATDHSFKEWVPELKGLGFPCSAVSLGFHLYLLIHKKRAHRIRCKLKRPFL